jgi:phage terminase small subunit
MSTDTKPLSPRHERFVQEFLKDGNATQAYIRAGYSPRGAQQSAARLLRDPRIEDAIAAGRARLAQALEVDVQRIAQEYAKIAFASVDDFVSTDENGRLRIDLEKANQAQRAGIVELRVDDHSKQQQTVTLKLGKLQALAVLTKQLGVLVTKPAAGLTPEDRQRYEERCAGYQRVLDHREEEKRQLRQELAQARAALDAARLKTGLENPNPSIFTGPRQPPEASSPPDPPQAQRQHAAVPGMPTDPQPDFRPGLYPNTKFIFSGGRHHKLGPDSADALRSMEPGGFAE